MGFDLNRFDGNVDEELICPICSFILEDPVQAPNCEHTFCESCINQWFKRQHTCPVDRTPIQPKDLKPVPRILKNLLSKLQLKCDYATFGCPSIIKLEHLQVHLHECEYNPKRPSICTAGCNMILSKDEMKNHNCIRELRKIITDQQIKINELSNELVKQKSDLEVFNNELRVLKSFATQYFRNFSNGNSMIMQPTNLSANAMMENDEIVRWSGTLSNAKVNRWGGIISTPDAVLQAVIKRALIDSRCPDHLLNELMDRIHERNWPSGLSTLETRQVNRNHYINYVCKRVPNKQAVLILACDNRHMPSHLVVEPGAILIFAHGVE